MNSSTDLDIPI